MYTLVYLRFTECTNLSLIWKSCNNPDVICLISAVLCCISSISFPLPKISYWFFPPKCCSLFFLQFVFALLFPMFQVGSFFSKTTSFPFSSVCWSFRFFGFPFFLFTPHCKVCVPIYRRLTDVASIHYASSIPQIICLFRKWMAVTPISAAFAVSLFTDFPVLHHSLSSDFLLFSQLSFLSFSLFFNSLCFGRFYP